MILEASPFIKWGGSDLREGRIPEDLANQMPMCELVGPDGLYFNETVRVGLWLQTKGVVYGPRKHSAEETFYIINGEAEWWSELKKTRLKGSGSYVFHPSVIDTIAANTVVSVERDVFPALVAAGKKIYGYVEDAYWLDIGTPRALLAGSKHLVGGEFKVDTTSRIAASAILQDGTSVGQHCNIDENTLISGSIICAGVDVGAGSEIKNSFVAPGSHVPKDSKIIGNYYSNELISPLNL